MIAVQMQPRAGVCRPGQLAGHPERLVLIGDRTDVLPPRPVAILRHGPADEKAGMNLCNHDVAWGDTLSRIGHQLPKRGQAALLLQGEDHSVWLFLQGDTLGGSEFALDTGTTTSRGSAVEGTAVKLFIDGTATVDAVVEFSGYTSGKVHGTFRFVDTANGSTGNCTALTWSIQRSQ